MRKELLDGGAWFLSLAEAQVELDLWVAHYNLEWEHQGIGHVTPIRRFELAESVPAEVLDPDADTQEPLPSTAHTVGRRVDRAGRISILKHRYPRRAPPRRPAGHGGVGRRACYVNS